MTKQNGVACHENLKQRRRLIRREDIPLHRCLHLQSDVLKAEVGVVWWVSVPYLVSKLSQPVRLQQQSRTKAGDKKKYEKCGRSYGENKEGQKEKKVKNGKSE